MVQISIIKLATFRFLCPSYSNYNIWVQMKNNEQLLKILQTRYYGDLVQDTDNRGGIKSRLLKSQSVKHGGQSDVETWGKELKKNSDIYFAQIGK